VNRRFEGPGIGGLVWVILSKGSGLIDLLVDEELFWPEEVPECHYQDEGHDCGPDLVSSKKCTHTDHLSAIKFKKGAAEMLAGPF